MLQRIELTLDTAQLIVQARDSSGRLASLIDAAGATTSYTYDSQHRMLTITDAKGIVYLTNEYDGWSAPPLT